MEKLGNLSQWPCLCPSLVSFLLQHSKHCHQVACQGGNQLKRFMTHPKLGCWYQRRATSTPQAACSSHQNLNLPAGVYCGQGQDGRTERGGRPERTTFEWRSEAERKSNGGYKNVPCQSMSRWLGNTAQLWWTNLGHLMVGDFNHLPDNVLLMPVFTGWPGTNHGTTLTSICFGRMGVG